MSGWRRAALAAIAAAVVSALVACTPAAESTSLTTEQSQSLAVVRVNNFDAGTRGFTTSEITERERTYSLDGYVDYRSGIVYASIMEAGTVTEEVYATADGIGSKPADDASAPPPLPAPSVATLGAEWQGRAIDPSTSTLDAFVAVLLSLGADRPENPLLLQQSDARFLGTEEIDGETVSKFSGPSSSQEPGATSRLIYWMNAENILVRFSVVLGEQQVDATYSDAPEGTTLAPADGSVPG